MGAYKRATLHVACQRQSQLYTYMYVQDDIHMCVGRRKGFYWGEGICYLKGGPCGNILQVASC